jgi:hypothetical protein
LFRIENEWQSGIYNPITNIHKQNHRRRPTDGKKKKKRKKKEEEEERRKEEEEEEEGEEEEDSIFLEVRDLKISFHSLCFE